MSALSLSGYLGLQVSTFTSGSTVADIAVKFQEGTKVTGSITSAVTSAVQTNVTNGDLDSLGVDKSVAITSSGEW